MESWIDIDIYMHAEMWHFGTGYYNVDKGIKCFQVYCKNLEKHELYTMLQCCAVNALIVLMSDFTTHLML